MKRIVFSLLILLAPPSLHSAFAQGVSPVLSGTETDAGLVMNRYFDSLLNGDVGTLKTLLGGELLKKRKSLLNNPEYSSYLATRYMNASFQILGYNSTGPNTLAVDVLITINQDELIRKRYLLEREQSGNGAIPYRITGERSLASDSP